MNIKQKKKIISRHYKAIAELKEKRPDKWELGVRFAIKRINALNRS